MVARDSHEPTDPPIKGMATLETLRYAPYAQCESHETLANGTI